jgi:hypothetical protein
MPCNAGTNSLLGSGILVLHEDTLLVISHVSFTSLGTIHLHDQYASIVRVELSCELIPSIL